MTNDILTIADLDLSEIADLITLDWQKPYFGAVPYIDAMQCLQTVDDNFGLDSGREIVMYFLANANTWRGATAREVKKHLKSLI